VSLTELVNERTVTGSPAERFASRDPDDFAEPRGREEEWRFTPLRRIRPLLDAGPGDAHLEWELTLPAGVEYAELPNDDPLLAAAPRPMDRLAALAFARSGKAAAVRVAKSAEVPEPAVVRLRGTGSTEAVWAHVVVDAGEQSAATVVLDYRGSARYAAQTTVVVGDGAHLTLVQLFDWDADTLHNEYVAVQVGRDATIRHTAVCLGGGLVRVAPAVTFGGPGGTAELLGVSFAGDGQHFESRLYVDHGVPECRSDVLYKNALLGDTARTVWIGDVRIRPEATGTSTYEMNRNLLLSGGARADSVPNLEIETGEIIGAGHASATGRFDDLQLFYLQSRGIPHDEAQRLVVRGFFADVVERIGVPDLQQRIMTAIEARLGFQPVEENCPE
jgi:Fe-S cluster assembly protein SufD